MSDANLITQLETALVGVPGFPADKILWPEKIKDDFNPAADITYLQPFHLPANSGLLTFDAVQENIGIYQVTILAPLNEYYDSMTLADTIRDHFKSVSLSGVEILQVNRAAAIRGKSHWSIPISINYRSIY